MNICCVLNRTGGTLRTTDLDWLSTLIKERFTAQGHTVTISIVEGEEMIPALENAGKTATCEAILVGGGDGSVSAAAAIAAKSGKPLAILPAGTMNMFARSLRTPLGLEEAVDALARGHVMAVDLAEVNDLTFIHQVSLGLHPRMVQLREREAFASRWGKVMAGIKALSMALYNARPLPLRIELDGARAIKIDTAALSVANNLYGEGHLPFADRLDGGVLGLYLSETHTVGELARLAFDTGIGNLKHNRNLDIETAKTITISHRRNRPMVAVVDGEVRRMPSRMRLSIKPGALSVIAPATEPSQTEATQSALPDEPEDPAFAPAG